MSQFTSTLPFLLNRAGAAIGELFSHELRRDDLTLPMYRVLAALAEQGDRRLIDLSALTNIEATTLSRMTVGLEHRGLITRHRPRDNLRVMLVGLTAEGRVLAHRLIARGVFYENVAVGDFDAGELTVLKDQLTRIFERLRAFEESDAGRTD